MKLSIVIPTLGEEGSLPATLAAVRELTADWADPSETIVVDGGSRDATATIAEEAGARVLVTPPGRGRQLRAGCEAATGEAILMLHADTVPCPAMGSQLAAALSDPQVGCGAFRQRIDASGVLYRWLEAGNAFRVRRLRTPYGDQAIFVRRALLERAGGVPDQPLMEDVELMRRLREHTQPVLLDGPLTVSARRWRRRGVVRQTATNWALVLAYRCGVSPSRLARWYGRETPTA